MIEHDASKQGRRTRTVLIGMIVSGAVLSRVTPRWTDRGLFPDGDRVSNLIGSMCVKHYKDFRKAPGAEIGSIVEAWASENQGDKETQQLLSTLLESLSGQYERLGDEINVEYTNKIAGKLFKRERIKQVLRDAGIEERNGRVDEAESKLLGYRRIELGGSAAISPLTDKVEIRAAYSEDNKPIIQYDIPAIDRFMQGALEREGFISFLAPNKAGKSFWLMDLACRALMAHKRVAFFLIGDMSKKQFLRRLYARLAVRPRSSPTGVWPVEVMMPQGIRMLPKPSDDKPWCAEVITKSKTFKNGTDETRAEAACDRWMTEIIRADDPYLMLSVHGGRTVSVLGIRSELEAMEQDGFVADVVLVDYADNLAPVNHRDERRDQVNETWLGLRALALENKCLVGTSTQCDTPGFDKWVLTRDNFSEDRRKLDHVTMMIGLNVGKRDKPFGITRLNVVNMRDGDFDNYKCCYVAGCLDVCNPAVAAVYPWGNPTEGEKRGLE